MPVSKTRKRSAQTETPVEVMARKRFTALARRAGHTFAGPAQYLPIGPPRECWTTAYENARRTGLAYAEGICVMPNGVHNHAWNVAEDGTVVEVTQGYEVASDYRGFVLDMIELGRVSGAWTGPRSSVLESGIASGVASPEAIVNRIALTGQSRRPS